MNFVSRSQWGARSPRAQTPLYPPDVRGVAIHYSAADADATSDHALCAARVRGIQRFHMDSRRWNDIAYNFLVCKHGYVYEGRGYYHRCAAQGTNAGNTQYLAVCFLGADRGGRDDVLPAGRKALGEIVRKILALYKASNVRPHSYFNLTACPGEELRAWIALDGWKQPKIEKSWPRPLPKWFWQWAAWRLGEGDFKDCGPANAASRPKSVPRVIPPWAWLRLRVLVQSRT